MGRKLSLVTVAMLACLSFAPQMAQAAEPIEGTWTYLGGQVLVEPDGGGFRGIVVQATRFDSCTHPVGERMWSISGSGSSYTGTHQWFNANACQEPQQPGEASWQVTETGDRFLLDFCTAKPGQGAPARGSSTTSCSALERVKPPASGPSGQPGASPRTVCSGPACLSGPAQLRSPGCLRRGDFLYRFPVRLRAAERRRLRVTATRFTLDWKLSGVDRRSPYVARVSGARMTPGTHLLIADVRLRGRRTGKSLHRRLSFRFDGCR